MTAFSLSPLEMLASLWRNRYLIGKSVQRDVLSRYRGSMLGVLWAFFYPLFMLMVYTFVFSVVFKARWPGTSGDSQIEFAMMLFAGLMVFTVFSECVNRAPGMVLANVNYVKKVVYPLEILPWIALGTALFNLAVSFVVWLLAYMVVFGAPHASVLLFPLVLGPLLFFTLGWTWFLAALGVYLRDIAQVVGIGTTALLFLSPIFYTVAGLPEDIRFVMRLNPLTPVIEESRTVLFGNGPVPPGELICCWLVSLVVAALGFAWFQKTRKGFADVL